MKKPNSRLSSVFALLPLAVAISNVNAQENAGAENTVPERPPISNEESQEVESQSNNNVVNKVEIDTSGIEDVLVLGRLFSAADDVSMERLEHETVADIIDFESIARIGDPNVAAALRRLPGITLVDGKFVYVRGLGERYSSTTLNGASVPSPDLTRNVIPLDIFPTTILQSVSVQKGYTADMPAAFGGGTIDIRTKGIPDGHVLSAEIGTSMNTNGDDYGYMYYESMDDSLGDADSGRDLPSEISDALVTYRGSIDANDILALDELQGGSMTIQDAQLVNRQLATSLNRNVDLRNEGSVGQDYSYKLSAGTSYMLDGGYEVGILVGTSYSKKYRNKTTIERSLGAPDQEFSTKFATNKTVDLTNNVAIGASMDEDNKIEGTYIFIRNTEDEASVKDYFTSNAPKQDGEGFRDTETEYEQRELKVTQFTGTHRLGSYFNDNERLGVLNDLSVDWYYSDAEATTDIPGAYNLTENTVTDPDSGEFIRVSRIEIGQRMIEYRYTDLDDEVDSSGFEVDLPLELDTSMITLSAGSENTKKARLYKQTDLFIGSSARPFDLNPILGGSFSELFADENLVDPTYEFSVALNSAGARSYLAGINIDAYFGQLDWNWEETIRVVLGARWEDYTQVGLPWQPYNFTSSQITTDPDELQDATFKEDKIYPSLSAAWMRQGFMGADDWQLRFAVSETVVRPDLREITETSYQDPLTDFIVSGNSEVVPSDIKNYDLRSEWYFGSGDSLTVSLFYKDISKPIEFLELPASDNKRAAGIFNSEAAEVYGVEVEWLQGLGKLSDHLIPFFFAGNITLAESEVQAPEGVTVQNQTRPLKGASEYVANLQFGFDSEDGKHAATLVYNVFGERVFAVGRQNDDSYEQPFNSLDLTYSWYPTEQATLGLKFQNLLGEDKIIEQGGVEVFNREVGTSASMSLKWKFF